MRHKTILPIGDLDLEITLVSYEEQDQKTTYELFVDCEKRNVQAFATFSRKSLPTTIGTYAQQYDETPKSHTMVLLHALLYALTYLKTMEPE